MIGKEYRQMTKDYIAWKKLHPKGLQSHWDYFVKQWQKGWRPKGGKE
jgi:hypothetical protein